MLPLCEELHITVNELLSGERIEIMEAYQKSANENLLQLRALEEEANKKLLKLECFVAMCYGLKIEQDVGYYECPECGERYKPTYWKVFIAPHMGRTRRMKCPHCGEKGWQKTVLAK